MSLFGGYFYAKVKNPERKGLITGIALGSIISPFSHGLYATFYIPIIGLVPGIIGLASSLFHGTPGYNITIWLGLHAEPTASRRVSSSLISSTFCFFNLFNQEWDNFIEVSNYPISCYIEYGRFRILVYSDDYI